jgi:ribosomal protein S14
VDYTDPTQDRIQRQPSEDSNKDKGKDRDRERDIEKGRDDLVARIKEVERARLREVAKRRLQDKKARMAELAAQVRLTN